MFGILIRIGVFIVLPIVCLQAGPAGWLLLAMILGVFVLLK